MHANANKKSILKKNPIKMNAYQLIHFIKIK